MVRYRERNHERCQSSRSATSPRLVMMELSLHPRGHFLRQESGSHLMDALNNSVERGKV